MSDDSVGMLGETLEDLDADFDEFELLEFLAADLDPVPADPRFKRELAEQLWDLVSSGRVPRPSRH